MQYLWASRLLSKSKYVWVPRGVFRRRTPHRHQNQYSRPACQGASLEGPKQFRSHFAQDGRSARFKNLLTSKAALGPNRQLEVPRPRAPELLPWKWTQNKFQNRAALISTYKECIKDIPINKFCLWTKGFNKWCVNARELDNLKCAHHSGENWINRNIVKWLNLVTSKTAGF